MIFRHRLCGRKAALVGHCSAKDRDRSNCRVEEAWDCCWVERNHASDASPLLCAVGAHNLTFVSILCDEIRAGEGGDAGVAADGADLLGERRELNVGDELHFAPERAEEVVVVGGDDDLGVEQGEDPPPVVLGEVAAGDAGEEDVDAALAHRVVDQVGAALVVEAKAATSIEMPQTWPQR